MLRNYFNQNTELFEDFLTSLGGLFRAFCDFFVTFCEFFLTFCDFFWTCLRLLGLFCDFSGNFWRLCGAFLRNFLEPLHFFDFSGSFFYTFPGSFFDFSFTFSGHF